MQNAAQTDAVATCFGVEVPPPPYLTQARISRINAGRYERQEIAGALKVITSDDVVLELGAGLGIVGAVTQVNTSPRKLYAYEANPDLIPHIKALHARNQLEGKIELRNRVLMIGPDRPETVSFYVQNSFLGSSTLKKALRKTQTVSVETADFNAVLAETGATVLVMGIEGGELELLHGADLSGIRAIVLEFHPEAYGAHGMKTCKDLLRDAGCGRIGTCPAERFGPVCATLNPSTLKRRTRPRQAQVAGGPTRLSPSRTQF